MSKSFELYEALGRAEKARHLCDLLGAAQIGSTAAARMSIEQWFTLAVAAAKGIEQDAKPPSEETRAEVIRFLREREDAALAVAGINPESWRKHGGLLGLVE